MPTYASKDVGFFLVGGRNILGSETEINEGAEAITADVTPIGPDGVWPTHQYLNQKRGALDQDGFFDATEDAANDAICGRQGTQQVVCLGNQGNVLARAFVAFAGVFAGKYSRVLSGSQVHKAKATYQITGEKEEPVILQAFATITAAGNTDTTPVDNTALNATGGAGYLQVEALTLGGYTNLTIAVRHSADNITYVDLLTFTAVTEARTAERKTVTGTVNRYLSTSRAWTGAGTGQSAKVLVGFARNPAA